jgi:hypothetical protein
MAEIPKSTKAVADDDTFIELFERYGAAETARRLGVGERNVYARRTRIEGRRGIKLLTPNVVKCRAPRNTLPENWVEQEDQIMRLDVADGVWMVGSDAHYFPGINTTGHRGFVAVARAIKPDGVCLNGDIIDLAAISRHAARGWEKRLTVNDEVECVKERLGEIDDAAPGAERVRTMGNHCRRYETRLASAAPEYKDIRGTRLRDHLPRWKVCTALWLGDHTYLVHRWHSGVHATHNNVVKGGVNFVTGDLHSLKATPWTSMRGTHYGIDTGTMADPDGPQFLYGEGKPKNWRSGFAVLTFRDGKLMPPELAEVIGEGLLWFRGKVWEV